MTQPYKRILALDFETAWDRKYYTLTKSTNEEYVRDKRFKAWGCAYQYLDDLKGHPVWVSRADLPAFFDSIDWTTTAALAHNAQFDVSILAWHYGHVPCFIFDTLSMARALRGVEVGNSLAKLADGFGLPPKGDAIHSSNGIMDALPPEVEEELGTYCEHDTALCIAIFDILGKDYPTKELRLIDLTLRAYVKPVLELDKHLLVDAIREEKGKREGLLAKLGIAQADLASNDKFAEVLRLMGVDPPTKISKTTNKEAYAFAKTDAMFQALVNHEREDISLLSEARMAVKSTLERTRAQRFLDIAQRGALPVPLNYYAAHTGRWGGSKGSGINMQNLSRGSFLRQAVHAPDGYVLLVADLAQIEPRVLAWLADDRYMLKVFGSGKDPYATFGAVLFGVPGMTKSTHPALRQSAKAALLGCFGADTPVLTQRGWVPILQVHNQDLLWDGEQWVQHRGVVAQGEKEVLTACGVSATSDHEILTEHGWRGWSAVLTNPSFFQSALSLGSLPAQDGKEKTGGTTLVCAALADGKDSLIGTTLNAEQLPDVLHALDEKELKRGGKRKDISLLAQITHTETVYWTALAQALSDVLILKIAFIRIMEGVALGYMHRGWQTVLNFLSTSFLSPVGMYQRFNWIASTINAGMNPAISGFAPVAKTCGTNEKQKPEKLKVLKKKIQTYDIAYAGPRNRYTILSNAGPLIVHNCGYGLGWASFAGQLMTGFLGADPVLYGISFAKQLGIRAKHCEAFMKDEEFVQRMKTIPRTCSNDELAVHCVVTKRIIDLYRNRAGPVVKFWRLCDDLISKCLVQDSSAARFGGRRTISHKCLTFSDGKILLPSGLCLRYPDIQGNPDEKGRVQWTYGDKSRKKLYGGKLTENIVQAVARVIMTDGMLRIQKRYPVVMTSHDEAGMLVLEDEADEAVKWVREQMIKEPRYMPGLPLEVSIDYAKRYGDAKV